MDGQVKIAAVPVIGRPDGYQAIEAKENTKAEAAQTYTNNASKLF